MSSLPLSPTLVGILGGKNATIIAFEIKCLEDQAARDAAKDKDNK